MRRAPEAEPPARVSLGLLEDEEAESHEQRQDEDLRMAAQEGEARGYRDSSCRPRSPALVKLQHAQQKQRRPRRGEHVARAAHSHQEEAVELECRAAKESGRNREAQPSQERVHERSGQEEVKRHRITDPRNGVAEVEGQRKRVQRVRLQRGKVGITAQDARVPERDLASGEKAAVVEPEELTASSGPVEGAQGSVGDAVREGIERLCRRDSVSLGLLVGRLQPGGLGHGSPVEVIVEASEDLGEAEGAAHGKRGCDCRRLEADFVQAFRQGLLLVRQPLSVRGQPVLPGIQARQHRCVRGLGRRGGGVEALEAGGGLRPAAKVWHGGLTARPGKSVVAERIQGDENDAFGCRF